MCDELEMFEFLESDASQQNQATRVKRRRLRVQADPFDMDDEQFVKRYRLSKTLVHNLCDELRPHMAEPTKSTDLSVETKVRSTLLLKLSNYCVEWQDHKRHHQERKLLYFNCHTYKSLLITFRFW